MKREAPVELRAVERRDVDQWRAWINREDVMQGLDRVLPATEEDHEKFIARHVAGNQSGVWFSVDSDGTYVGTIWLWDLHWRHRRAEVRLFIAHPDFQGRGVATAAISSISWYAFNSLGLHKLYAYVHVSNQVSRRAFEAADFTIEATLKEEAFRDGAYTDVFRMSSFSGVSGTR
ncbi:MAG: GNAT family N-acetyltransferase [Candidatus Eremiobacteraeota bacterium]|nr:GNAT family N-acetyltransferase [Candidatus Eremiobacteraeota bacterium]